MARERSLGRSMYTRAIMYQQAEACYSTDPWFGPKCHPNHVARCLPSSPDRGELHPAFGHERPFVVRYLESPLASYRDLALGYREFRHAEQIKEPPDPSVDLLPADNPGIVGRHQDGILRQIARDAIRIICEPRLIDLLTGAVDRFCSYVWPPFTGLYTRRSCMDNSISLCG